MKNDPEQLNAVMRVSISFHPPHKEKQKEAVTFVVNKNAQQLFLESSWSLFQIRTLLTMYISLFSLSHPQVMASYDRALFMRLYVHVTLFRESIFTHGTKEQWLKWKVGYHFIRDTIIPRCCG